MSVKQRQSDGTLRDIAGYGNYALDSEMSSTSINGVQNRIITAALNTKATQYSSLPTASEDNLGLVVQYIGNVSGFSTGGFYQCQEDSGSYSWVLLSQDMTNYVEQYYQSTEPTPERTGAVWISATDVP